MKLRAFAGMRWISRDTAFASIQSVSRRDRCAPQGAKRSMLFWKLRFKQTHLAAVASMSFLPPARINRILVFGKPGSGSASPIPLIACGMPSPAPQRMTAGFTKAQWQRSSATASVRGILPAPTFTRPTPLCSRRATRFATGLWRTINQGGSVVYPI